MSRVDRNGIFISPKFPSHSHLNDDNAALLESPCDQDTLASRHGKPVSGTTYVHGDTYREEGSAVDRTIFIRPP